MNIMNLLPTDLEVKVIENDFGNNIPAKVCKYGNKSYQIFINSKILDKFDGEERTVLKEGLKLHETAHILYESEFYKNTNLEYSNVWSWINNILEDARIEYKLSLEYPVCINIFKMTLKLVDSIKIDKGDEENSLTDEEESFNNEISELFRYVRYNEEPLDETTRNFLLPLILSSKRGDRRNCSYISNILYNYYIYNLNSEDTKNEDIEDTDDFENKYNKNDNNSNDSNNSNQNQNKKRNVGNTKFEELTEELKNLIQKSKDDNGIGEVIKLGNGLNSNLDGIKIDDDEVYNACIKDRNFYYLTVKNNIQLIHDIETSFKKKLNKTTRVLSKEGDISINPIKQMNAYLNSFTGEEGFNFEVTKKTEPEFDICILRDVSGSTYEFEKEYAEITICFIEALHKFKYVNVASIDFGSKANITKKFNDIVPGIIPYNSGSTNLSGALRLMKDIQWKNKQRYCIIFTDGYPDYKSEVTNLIKEKFYQDMQIIPLILFRENINLFDNDIYIKKLNDIPKKLMEVIR